VRVRATGWSEVLAHVCAFVAVSRTRANQRDLTLRNDPLVDARGQAVVRMTFAQMLVGTVACGEILAIATSTSCRHVTEDFFSIPSAGAM
jgi:hypothetical protein